MSDDRRLSRPGDADEAPLEAWLQALADDYNRPPPPDREAMWARIQAARAAGTVDAEESVTLDAGRMAATPPVRLVVDESVAHVRPTGMASRSSRVGLPASGRGRTAWRWASLGMAAALLLVASLGWWRHRSELNAPQSSPQPSELAAGVPSKAPVESLAGSSAGTTVSESSDNPPTVEPAAPAPRLYASSVAGRSASAARPVSAIGVGAETSAAAPAFDSEPYRVAVAQHLGQVEALLTVFRAESERDIADPSLQPWARELLTTTRLLLDSPAPRDEGTEALLGALEPVLVQIVQLPAARAAEERQLIALSLEQNSLLTQLRSAVPAGTAVPQRAGE